MKIVILAAGVGSRLAPITNEIPKCMINIGEKPILGYMLEHLKNQGCHEVAIVTGHQQQVIEEYSMNFEGVDILTFRNKNYESMNNIYSLHMMQEYLLEDNDGFILINSDVLCEEEIVKQTYQNLDRPNFMIVDSNKKLADEEMKVVVDGEKIIHISKQINPDQAFGEYIGICKFSHNVAKQLFEATTKMINNKEHNKWYEDAINEILGDSRIEPVPIGNYKWIEIDSHSDLKEAQNLFQLDHTGV